MIELLVVIAIIGILAAMLLPVLGRAREKANAAACLSNMHQWALAIGLYNDDWNDYYPYDGNFTGGLVCGVDTWFDVLPKYLNNQPGLCYLYNATPPNPPTWRRRSIWICPSLRFNGPIPTRQVPYFNYAISVCLHSRNTLSGTKATLVGFRRDRMVSPANTIIFCEENIYQTTYGETRGDSLSSRGTDGTYDPSVANHTGGMHFVLGDGHCEWIKVTDFCRNCPNQPYRWDTSDLSGDWNAKGLPPYHWWFAPGISTMSN